MTIRPTRLIYRYARPACAYYTFIPESLGSAAAAERSGLKLVVHNRTPRTHSTFTPSPRYHTGD